MKNKNKKNNNKSKIVSRFFDSSHVGSEVTLTEVKERAFFSFFPDCSVTAKILAHLRLSWLYLIYLITKCISFLKEKDEFSKILLVWLCSSVCSIAQLVSGWHGFESRPSLNLFFTVNFSAIGKIAAHLRGSCLHLILIHNSKETYFVTNSYRKVA